MKNIIKTISLLAVLSTSAQAIVSVNVIANSTTGLYQTSTLGSTAGSLYQFGYLDEAAYDSLGADQTDFASVDTIFTSIGSGNVAGDGSIFSLGNSANIPASGEPQPGTALYMWVFNDTAGATADEWGIYSSSNWVMPNDLGIVSLSSSLIDNVVAGGTSGANFTLVAVPEASTYAALSGLLALGCVMVRRRRA